MDINDIIRKHALANATKFGGKANPKAMIGKLMSEAPEVKKDMKATMESINTIVADVNLLSLEAQMSELTCKYPEMLEEKTKSTKKELKELKDVDSRPFVVRFEPSPSGPMHIGHAYPASLNYLYAKKYNGKFIIRISDTNPDNIDPDAYDMIKENAEWMFGKNSFEYYIQSDRMTIYYDYTEKLIKKNAAYVCTCDAEVFRDLSVNKKPCPCRDLLTVQNLNRWENMLHTDGYKMGEAVVRFKSDIEHKNPAMRDFALMRINDNEHERQGKKYRVWPLMMMSVAIDDMTTNISHTLRGKDHMDNAKKQAMIHKVLGYKTPESISVGRINFTGFAVSCSKTRVKIEDGEFENWGDIRIPFIPAIAKRGYTPESLIEFAKEIGVTQNDKSVTIEDYFKTINAFNKSILDAKTRRRFFTLDPVKIIITGAPKRKVILKSHPDKDLGTREFDCNEEYYVAKNDFDRINDGDIVRLMDNLNFVKNGANFTFVSLSVDDFKGKGKLAVHWIPCSEVISCSVLMPNNEELFGYIEKTSIDTDEIIQMERFGFGKVQSADDEQVKIWFAHK